MPHASLHQSLARLWQGAEHRLDASFGAEANPLRHLGALAFLLFWLLTGTGIYLYIVMETSVEGAYRSIDTLSGIGVGGIIRSLHRYAADAFVLCVLTHLLREWLLDRYSGFRWYSWLSGLPLLALMFASGIGGYWLPWDRLAQYSAVASAEWLDWWPLFTEPVARNFQTPGAVSDRLFTLLIFLHLGLPLLLILGAWAHVHRISRVEHLPRRALALGCVGALTVLALLQPARSGTPADLAQAVAVVPLDWIILFVHPLAEHLGAAPAWALLGVIGLLLLALPWLQRRPRAPAARVDAQNCNGCRRCYEDCPYGAISMLPNPHPLNRWRQIAVVASDYCAGCGICVGACPSATPFRRQQSLRSGIDLPDLPVDVLRTRLDRWLDATMPDALPRVLVVGCEHGAPLRALADAATLTLPLRCTAMLPPAFVDYALRHGADGVLLSTCRPGSCHYRLGNDWLRQRIAGQREPALRAGVPRARVRLSAADASDAEALRAELEAFRAQLSRTGAMPGGGLQGDDDVRPH